MTPEKYTIDLPAFSGPLDLLLHLVERQELDITAISLATVTAQYLAHVEQMKENRFEQLIDFLVIGARLVLVKSRALLPQIPPLPGEEEEEDPAEALVRQLRQYKRFKDAAQWLHEREAQGLRTYLRVAPPPKLEGRVDMSGITVEALLGALHEALARAEEREESVAIIQPRRITIDGQIKRLRYRLQRGEKVHFGDLLSRQATGIEVAITLLAVLELIKRREIRAVQTVMFGPIEIMATAEMNDAAAANADEMPDVEPVAAPSPLPASQ